MLADVHPSSGSLIRACQPGIHLGPELLYPTRSRPSRTLGEAYGGPSESINCFAGTFCQVGWLYLAQLASDQSSGNLVTLSYPTPSVSPAGQ
ncbi:hypothetical protein DSO57_1021058 [Entomophthora muscae]|uniref:Uncharacterized protein n=1 Tax=Entomophthora muscae TaxID=34485 RepID=A0ACC2T3Q3_9FUNG|nr:hypothetical protein DSO57_1021058 [Entomophthora muscae]